ncbi:MAG TPA: VCBS repeat-containing protein, partial [Lacunisphaera sp.]|nr:VCBS repeat-containing protein [Lacunisphaera sp.]
EPTAVPAAKAPTNAPALTYASATIGTPPGEKPWITYVMFADLDQDGQIDGLACDAATNTVVWLRQDPSGVFTESALATGLAGPVHVQPIDLDGDGDLDVLVACMGRVMPTNERIGSVVVLENMGANRFSPRTLLADTARVTDVQAGDFNDDGRLDLAVAKFGYYEGEVTWMENRGNWTFTEHPLLNLPGAVNVCVADLNGDRRPDIAAVISQQYEEIHLFENRGGGQFSSTVIFGSTNEDFGSSGISLADVNRDGKMDILFTNGDGFDYAEPGRRPWHGIQWLENTGTGAFRYHRVANFPGAYSPVGVDLDGDRDVDLVCASGFNDWKNPQAVSLMAYLNDGRQNFTAQPLANAPTHLVSLAAADLDGDGRPELLTGGFHTYPPWDRVSRLRLWRPEVRP